MSGVPAACGERGVGVACLQDSGDDIKLSVVPWSIDHDHSPGKPDPGQGMSHAPTFGYGLAGKGRRQGRMQ